MSFGGGMLQKRNGLSKKKHIVIEITEGDEQFSTKGNIE